MNNEIISAKIANEFSRWLRSKIEPVTMDEINRLNATPEYQAGACATQDFCDANQYMLNAFQEVMGEEWTTPSEAEGDEELERKSEEQSDLMQAAWNIARAANFIPVPLPPPVIELHPQNTVIEMATTGDTGGGIYNDVIWLNNGHYLRITAEAVTAHKTDREDDEDEPVGTIFF